MQFIPHGPHIPEALLEAQEEGRLVFFCGAGISYPADLPSFKGLVGAIYSIVGTSPNAIEQEAYDRNQFDATLDLLERRLPGQRLALRKALAQSLRPKLRRKGATDTHEALLQLGRSREGALRLVTTNFDRIFQYVAKRAKMPLGCFAAPMLPIPKNSRWDGLVYLHGLLPDVPDDSALHRLVVTSGDFGLAYLTERWAARFVSELFRHYVVCFVGYSINDPVLRYMMDALAADRMLGEVTPQAYAFGDCPAGEEARKTIEWGAKGVTPILYDPAKQHAAMHGTLKAWAETWRDGVLGRERIVADYAIARPSASTTEDNFVSRMLWALVHHSGLPAKRLAEFDPVPSLDWLDAFKEAQFGFADLPRFEIPTKGERDAKLQFGLIRRPAPYSLAPWMALASGPLSASRWDAVMFQLARWLTRHLNEPKLVIWIAEQGGQVHEQWIWLIERELDRFDRLQREGNAHELDQIRTNAPNAIPEPFMRTLWKLLIGGRVKAPWRDTDLYGWLERFNRDGFSSTLRIELRELLAPKITIKAPFRWPAADDGTATSNDAEKSVDWELVLAADHVTTTLRDHTRGAWQQMLPLLLGDFQQLLRDALDLLRELNHADDRNDRSHWDLPSISPHKQNRGYRDWVMLIELLRDAWLAMRQQDLLRAQRVAQDWFEIPYPTFKRLSLFAASQDQTLAQSQAVAWLLADNDFWLWAVDTKREAMRLLVLQGSKFNAPELTRLESAILAGPPRKMYRDDLEPERWNRIVDLAVWLRLAKLASSGAVLGDAAAEKLAALATAYPGLKLAANENDEFSHWMSGTGDEDYEEVRDIETAPRSRAALVNWLRKPPPENRPFYEDTWRATCSTRFFHCLFALCDLGREGVWPQSRWAEALQVWAGEGERHRAWRWTSPLLLAMSEDCFAYCAHGVSSFLESVAKTEYVQPDAFFALYRRVLAIPDADEAASDHPVSDAINHPIGHATRALLELWLARKPSDNDKLPSDIEPLLTELCDVRVARYRHGRSLLAAHLIVLFRVDPEWTRARLLPLFDWTRNTAEAKGAWEGFLWSPRIYGPLLVAFKQEFLATAGHYEQLGEHDRQFAMFLTYAALHAPDGYEPREFHTAVSALPQSGLDEVASALSQALEAAGEQREDYWKNRVAPFWRNIWPKSRDRASDSIAESLARMAIAAGDEFPAAQAAVHDWIRHIEHPSYPIHRLDETGIARRFPKDALSLLDRLVEDQQWPPRELGKCLDDIKQSAPGLESDPRYQRLRDYARRHGVG